MNTSPSRIFIPIPRSRARDSILADAALNKEDIYIKYSEAYTVKTKILKWAPPFKLQLENPTGPRLIVNKLLTVHFSTKNEKYFTQAAILDTGTHFYLVIEGPLFQLQRRQSFRLKLPAHYPVKTEVFELNGHRMNEESKLLDISEGGCSLLVSSQFAQAMGSHIGIAFKFESSGNFNLYGNIRYLKAQKHLIRLGIKFDGNNNGAELFHITRDLYVKLFSRWSKKR